MMTNWKLDLMCTTDTGVTFWANCQVLGDDQQDAIVRGIKHVIDNGCLIILQTGAPPIPIKPICAVPLRIEEIPVVHLATQMPKSKQEIV